MKSKLQQIKTGLNIIEVKTSLWNKIMLQSYNTLTGLCSILLGQWDIMHEELMIDPIRAFVGKRRRFNFVNPIFPTIKKVFMCHSVLKGEITEKNVSKDLSMNSISKIYFDLDKLWSKIWELRLFEMPNFYYCLIKGKLAKK